MSALPSSPSAARPRDGLADVIRVVIQQNSLPKYRLPAFRALAARPGLRVKLMYGQIPDIANVTPDGFDAELVPMSRWHLGRMPVYWHRAQMRAARRAEADVAVLSWDMHYASLLPALLRARRQGVGTVLWGHGYSKREAGWRRRLREKAARLADALLLYNRAAADAIASRGIGRDRLFVAANTVDMSPIRAARDAWLAKPAELKAFRQQQGIASGPLVLFVSRFDPDNRVDLLIDAAAALSTKYPTLRVAIIGKGEIEPDLRAHVAARGVADRVLFPGAIYDEHALAPWMLSASVFCYPANIGLSLVHAMGYGLPVVTSDRTDAQNPEIEALRHEENGLLYADGDAAALAAALDRLLADEPLRSRLGATAARTAHEEYSLDRMVDGMEAAIRFAYARRRRRA